MERKTGIHTPGPWRWEFNRKNRSIQLVGGRPQFDKTVMDFERWGMGGSCPRFNEKISGNELNIMTRVSDRKDWIAPFEGRAHHVEWCADVVHPDARLIAAAPSLLAALEAIEPFLPVTTAADGGAAAYSTHVRAADLVRAAIAAAKGSAA
ncbi:hypothetical protein [Chromobacterium violaceum]|uniref:hypothetical protein n=1 Tax=Chromobacterium violaceum TaxID=536 RepID=UPI0009DAA258|nr:hypothetical protein [Chromobacterium violaceum]